MARSDEVPGYDDLVEIGRGGYATVYRAVQRATGRHVAVKVLQTDHASPEATRRVERELAALRALAGHPHVVAVLDTGVTTADRPYLVTELLDGGTAAERRPRRPWPWPEAVVVGIEIAGALEAAHRAGVVHRDVKPANVLFDADGRSALVDFGVASVLGVDASSSGSLTASVPFVAPEVIDGGRPSVASDVYALGATLFALLTGRSPFLTATDRYYTAAAARARVHPLPDVRPLGVPGDVAAAVERAMAREPGRRWPTAAAFGEDLVACQQAAGCRPTPLVVAVPPADPVA
jgi:serine/threonine protein kinase